MAEQFRYLANDVDISDFYDKLPKILKNLIADAERLDREDNEGELLGTCEAIESIGKQYLPDVLSVEEWERLCEKYYTY